MLIHRGIAEISVPNTLHVCQQSPHEVSELQIALSPFDQVDITRQLLFPLWFCSLFPCCSTCSHSRLRSRLLCSTQKPEQRGEASFVDVPVSRLQWSKGLPQSHHSSAKPNLRTSQIASPSQTDPLGLSQAQQHPLEPFPRFPGS